MVNRLQTVQGLLLEAAFDSTALKSALSAFADFCGAPIAHLMIADGKRTLLTSTFSRDLDPACAEREWDYQHINPRVLAIPRMQQGKSTRDKDFIRYDKIKKDQTYQELILPMGLGHFSAVPMIHTPDLTAGIALHCPFFDDPFNDAVASRHERAAAECLPVFNLIAAIENTNASNAMDLLGADSATAAVDHSGQVITANETFEGYVHSRQINLTRDRRISLKQMQDQARLIHALRSQNGAAREKFIVAASRGRTKFICHVLPLPPISSFSIGRASKLISFRVLENPRPPNQSLVAEAFDLTPAEADVACLLFTGLNLEQISQRRGVSIGTTRSLIKRVLTKSNCSRQAELVAAMTSLT